MHKLDQPGPVVDLPAASQPMSHRGLGRPFMAFAIVTVVLCAAFALPLLNWGRFALSNDRNTYLLLVPVVSIYLIRTSRRALACESPSSIGVALLPVAIAFASLAGSVIPSDPLDRLSLQMFALLNLLLSSGFLFFGTATVRHLSFPIAFLIFAVPMPPAFGEKIEIFLQYTSAEAAYWLMSLVGIPMIRDGIDFRLPNLYIQVAQECSGYNSTFCLFMVSTVAAYMFLKSPWRRVALCVAVIPLAILRNGFRVTTLASLCVYDDPKWIDSSLHHKGGPLFFLLSLIPFFILLWGLRKSEIAKARPN